MGRDTTAEKLKEDEAHQKAGGVTDKAVGTRLAGAGNKRRSEKQNRGRGQMSTECQRLEQAIARGRGEKRK